MGFVKHYANSQLSIDMSELEKLSFADLAAMKEYAISMLPYGDDDGSNEAGIARMHEQAYLDAISSIDQMMEIRFNFCFKVQ